MIRKLNIEELESEIQDQAHNVEYVESQHLLIQPMFLWMAFAKSQRFHTKEWVDKENNRHRE